MNVNRFRGAGLRRRSRQLRLVEPSPPAISDSTLSQSDVVGQTNPAAPPWSDRGDVAEVFRWIAAVYGVALERSTILKLTFVGAKPIDIVTAARELIQAHAGLSPRSLYTATREVLAQSPADDWRSAKRPWTVELVQLWALGRIPGTTPVVASGLLAIADGLNGLGDIIRRRRESALPITLYLLRQDAQRAREAARLASSKSSVDATSGSDRCSA